MKQNILNIDTTPNPGVPDYAGYDDKVRDDFDSTGMLEEYMPLTPKYDAPDGDNDPTVDELIDAMGDRKLVEDLIDKAKLDDREQDVLLKRYGFFGDPMTLEAMGQEYDLTQERIRQIEVRALRKLRRAAVCM